MRLRTIIMTVAALLAAAAVAVLSQGPAQAAVELAGYTWSN